MTQIIPTRSQDISFTLDRRILACWLASDFDICGMSGQAEKISRPDQKKGG